MRYSPGHQQFATLQHTPFEALSKVEDSAASLKPSCHNRHGLCSPATPRVQRSDVVRMSNGVRRAPKQASAPCHAKAYVTEAHIMVASTACRIKLFCHHCHMKVQSGHHESLGVCHGQNIRRQPLQTDVSTLLCCSRSLLGAFQGWRSHSESCRAQLSQLPWDCSAWLLPEPEGLPWSECLDAFSPGGP